MTALKKTSKSKAKKVWHICRFRERYELPDDVYYDRRGPLLYTKDFIGSGSDDESCAYWRQLMALRSKTNWLVLRGAFAELKNISGNQSNTYRGYLLNSMFEPASEKEIGRWLGVDENQAEHIVTELKDVGLLEQVDFPKFDADDNKPTKSKANKRSTTKRKKTTAKSSGRKNTRTQNSAKRHEISRNHAKPAEIKRNHTKPLKKKIKAKGKIKVKTNEQVDNGNPKRNINKNRQNRSRDNSNSVEGKTKSEAKFSSTKCRKAALAPATAPPIMPLASDARGSGVIQFPAPSGSAQDKRGPQRIGDIVSGMIHRYDVDAKQFSGDIYQALNIQFDPRSTQGSRELGSFASLWNKAKRSGLPPPVLDELWNRAVDEARKLTKRRRKCSNISAVWCTIFNRLLSTRCSNSQCKVM